MFRIEAGSDPCLCDTHHLFSSRTSPTRWLQTISDRA
jgi:hypothetical protein